MTSLPPPSAKKLGLVIDLDTCVGCQACATSCKEWNTQGYSAPLNDVNPYGSDPSGTWLNRIHGYEVKEQGQAQSRIVNFPRSCLHCEEPACVTVCPTGASYKRAEDGIVLVNPETCIGCKLCSWACPYGAREYDAPSGVMKKCTLCVDRIYNENFEPEDRQPACVKACPTEPATSATSAIQRRTSRSSSPSAAAMTFCPRWATSPSTSIFRRAPGAMPPTRKPKPCRSPMAPPSTGSSPGPTSCCRARRPRRA